MHHRGPIGSSVPVEETWDGDHPNPVGSIPERLRGPDDARGVVEWVGPTGTWDAPGEAGWGDQSVRRPAGAGANRRRHSESAWRGDWDESSWAPLRKDEPAHWGALAGSRAENAPFSSAPPRGAC